MEVWGRNLLAGLAWAAGDADRIVAEIEASRALSGQADPALASRAQVLLANAAWLAGDLAERERHALLAVKLARTAPGQEGLALALTVSATAAIVGARIQPATVAALDEAAKVLTAHPDRFGVLAAARERHADAARLLGAAAAARRPLRYLAPGFTANRDAAAAAASQARQILGEGRFSQAWDQGQALALDDAVAYAARKGGGRKRPAASWASLTPAEREIVRLAGEGLRNDAIARRLFIAPGTVKVHLSHIFAKLGITTRAELAAQAAAQDPTAR